LLTDGIIYSPRVAQETKLRQELDNNWGDVILPYSLLTVEQALQAATAASSYSCKGQCENTDSLQRNPTVYEINTTVELRKRTGGTKVSRLSATRRKIAWTDQICVDKITRRL